MNNSWLRSSLATALGVLAVWFVPLQAQAEGEEDGPPCEGLSLPGPPATPNPRVNQTYSCTPNPPPNITWHWICRKSNLTSCRDLWWRYQCCKTGTGIYWWGYAWKYDPSIVGSECDINGCTG